MKTEIDQLTAQIYYSGFTGKITTSNNRQLPLAEALTGKIEQKPDFFGLNMEIEYGPLASRDRLYALIIVKFDQVTLQYTFDSFQLSVWKHNQNKLLSGFFKNTYFDKKKLAKKRNAGNTTGVFIPVKNNNITLKEAYNLLCGGAVCKEMPRPDLTLREVWYQRDPTYTGRGLRLLVRDPDLGNVFDFNAAFSGLPILANNKPLIADQLKRGNTYQVTVLVAGNTHEVTLEVNALEKQIMVFTKEGIRLPEKSMQVLYEAAILNAGDTTQQRIESSCKTENSAISDTATQLPVKIPAAKTCKKNNVKNAGAANTPQADSKLKAKRKVKP